MKNIFISLMLFACVATAEEKYLEVREKVEGVSFTGMPQPTFVRVLATDITDASNQLASVTNDYFVGIEFTASFHEHYHGATEYKPCEVTPLSQGLSKYIEVSTIVDERYNLPEMIRTGYTDDADADKKVDKVKKSKWFKNKQVKVVKK